MAAAAAAAPMLPTPVGRRPLEVIHWRAVGPRGETVLDPVFAELLFVERWRHLPVRLIPSCYPSVRALGPLPAAVCGAPICPAARCDLLEAAAALDPLGYGAPMPSPTDEALRGLLRLRVGSALEALLFGDQGLWEDYTRPTLAGSAPRGFGWAVAWREQRRRAGGLGPETLRDRRAAAVLSLEPALEALAQRLDGAESFGRHPSSGEADVPFTPLDACAYGHLAVLYSIPCQEGSQLHDLLGRFPSLAHFCDHVEARLGGVWPDAGSFLAAVPPRSRMPGAAGTLFGQDVPRTPMSPSASPSAGVDGAGRGGEPGGLEWWEVWGWSWGGGRKRMPQPKVRRHGPPDWYMAAFGSASALAVGAALALGCSPLPVAGLLAVLQKALQDGGGGGGALPGGGEG